MAIDFNDWGGPPDEPINYDKINAVALNNMQAVFAQFQPGGKMNGREYICGNLYGGPGKSCSTNINTGVGKEFSSDVPWGDPVDFISKIRNIRMSEAAQVLTEFLQIDSSTPTPKIEKQSSAEKYAAGQTTAVGLWSEASECPPQHPYITAKGLYGLTSNEVRLHIPTGDLLIPLKDEIGKLWSVQRITPSGEKKINNNGKMGGNFLIVDGNPDTVYICEGYATAKTVALMTDHIAVMAVSTGNLTPVAEKLCKLYPRSHIVFAADNDQDKPENPGITAAQKAVKQLGRGTVVAPPFPPGEKGDWNDYAIANGGKATRDLLLVHSKKALPVLIDLMDFAPTPPTYLIDKLIETPCTGMLVGASGSGKTFVALDWALSVATGRKWCGRDVKQGPVIYICGEGKYGIARRAGAWFHRHGTTQGRGQFFLTTSRVEINQVASVALMADIDQIAANRGAPAMLIIDTLARSLPADADENSAGDMQVWINCIDEIRDRYNCTVLIVHHTGHADATKGRARGSSALKGAMDLEILVDKTRGVLECTKGKDMEPWTPITYELKSVQVTPEWGSAVVDYSFDYNPKKNNRTTAFRKAALEAMQTAIKAEGLEDRCSQDAWLDAFVELFPEDTRRKCWARLLNKEQGEAVKLIEDGQVSKIGRLFVLVKSELDKTADMFSRLTH